jgi:Helix-hairpin-helix motif
MLLYTRKQILLVLLLVGAAGAGLAVDHWRRARPELVERLETIDRAAPAGAADGRRPTDAPRLLRRGPARPTREAEHAGERRHARETSEPKASPPPVGAPVDVNRATVPELRRLPGIGPALAARIVDARPFTALDDLTRVRGLRRATLDRLRPRLTVLP